MFLPPVASKAIPDVVLALEVVAQSLVIAPTSPFVIGAFPSVQAA